MKAKIITAAETEKEGKIRTLGFYQPFGTLMLHGKVETRWVREGKKPPFPMGKYLFYTTKKPCRDRDILEWCGEDIPFRIGEKSAGDTTIRLNGYAIGTGELTEPYWMRTEDEADGYVLCSRIKTITNKKGENIIMRQWCLPFKNVQRIEPFEWSFGKQGVGFVPESEIDKIKPLPDPS